MVTTVTRALPLPARRSASLLAGVVLLLVLSFPLAAGAPQEGIGSAPSSIDATASQADTAATGPSPTAQGAGKEVRPYVGPQTIALGPPASTCDQRLVLRDLPDAVPSCALRLAVWDQPWWPLPLPHFDPVPERIDAKGLPSTRAPPLTAHATV
ncbi:hypothetical protein [Nocardiopsis alkaliphila]|uniref:hypothetical protein n=1 Tax=Nocardiopsis alkaliphila TaxID=225762 RepID=UPI00035EF679|nr:hypothetical protein [Nocardiopsis alkaliphila]